MRSAVIFLAALVFSSSSFSQSPSPVAPAPAAASAQTETGKETLALTRDEITTVARFQSDTVTRIFGVKITVDGVIPMALRTRHPLQLINPLAPAEYGNGFENVTSDPDTRQATGIRFLGIKF